MTPQHGDTVLDAIGRIVWETSRADEGTISVTGALIVARALIADLPTDAIVALARQRGCRVISTPPVTWTPPTDG